MSSKPGGEDPYFWASKLHFYITGITFYNFPYTFGYLLSRGLYAMFKKEGTDFLPKYEEFLRRAGSDTAENVVKQTVGRDIEKTEFWTEAIQSLEEPLKNNCSANAMPKSNETRNSNCLTHPFQQRRPQQIDGVERHARAIISAAAGAGAFATQKISCHR